LRGQAKDVLACADRAEAHWRAAEAGLVERATALRLRGMGLQLLKEYESAIASHSQAVALLRGHNGESSELAIVLNSLARAEQMSGDLDAAESHFCEALRIARDLRLDEGIALYLGNLAALAIRRRDWCRAEQLCREALPLSESIGRLELIAANCDRLGRALVAQQKKDEAVAHARRAVTLFSRLGLPEVDRTRQLLAECESQAAQPT
jgi:tetratricopeptide (TPR) repeat protein